MSEVEYRAELARALAEIMTAQGCITRRYMPDCWDSLDRAIQCIRTVLQAPATLAQKPVDAGKDGE